MKNFLAKLNQRYTKLSPIGSFRKLQNVLRRLAFLTIYKSFIRSQLDYGDIIHDKAFNNFFHAKLASFQCNAALAITGAIRGSSVEKIYEGLGLDFLKMLVQKNDFFVLISQK